MKAIKGPAIFLAQFMGDSAPFNQLASICSWAKSLGFERFLDQVNGHVRANILYDPSHFVLQCLDYLSFIDHYHDCISYGFHDWAVMEGECCLKHPEVGAAEGSEFIKRHIIPVTEKAFDDFAGGYNDEAFSRKLLGI